MKYWWVNLGATSSIALDEGYLWSPKTNRNGKASYLVYDVMKEPKLGDIVIANVKGKIVSKGKVIKTAYDSIKPRDFEDDKDHSYWDKDGYRIDVNFEELKAPLDVKEFDLEKIDMFREKYFPINSVGKAYEAYLMPINEGLWKYMNIDESFRDTYNPSEHVNMVEEVLKINHQKGPMHYRDITESAINLGLLNKYGKTPERSFNRTLNENLSTRFNSHGDGLFSLKGYAPKKEDKKIILKDYVKPKTLDESTKDVLSKSGAKKRKAAYNTHNEMQNEISDHLETKGIKILDSSSPNVDLCWKKGDQFYFLEVKSIHDGNENEQIRRGIGQVAEYRYHFEEQGYIVEKAFLAVTRKPSKKHWEKVCSGLDIQLITPASISRTAS